MSLREGTQIGHFVVLRSLGAGAMGEVHLARDSRIDRLVAIKTLRLESAGVLSESELRARLLREAKAAGSLVHPHVVTLFEAGQDGDSLFLVFEYVEGVDLSKRIQDGPPLSLLDVLRIGRQSASALAAAHDRGIVHRDIKPSNMLLDAHGSLKISDFGIAKLSDQHTRLTRMDAVVGTPQYLAPEQIRGDTVRGSSDLFSLGVVLYELLAGRPPFHGDSMTTLISHILVGTPEPLTSLRPDLPRRLANAVMRLLEKEPADRFPSAASLESEVTLIEREVAADRGASTRFAPTTRLDAPTSLRATSAAAGGRMQADSISRASREVAHRLPAWLSLRATKLLAATLAGVLVLLLALRWIATEVEVEPAPRARSASGANPTSTVPTVSPTVPDNTETSPPSPSVMEERDGGTSEAGATAPETSLAQPRPQAPDPSPYRRPPANSTSNLQVDRVVWVDAGGRATVSGSVSFQVSPLAAARRAVVKIDGQVRGPAAGSFMTLPPGRHSVEIVADGYDPFTFTIHVDASRSSWIGLGLDMERR